MQPNEKEHHTHHSPTINLDDFEELLQKASDLRGHRCLGLPLGIKMAQLGIKLLNLSDNDRQEYLMVFVENDKCPADGIQIATGCSAGSRKFKMLYYGKSAATFVDSRTGRGYRVVSKKDLATRALELAIKDNIIKVGEKVEVMSKLERQVLMNAFMKLKPEELLDAYTVEVAWDSPLVSSRMEPFVYCSKCGEEIMSGMGVKQDNEVLCRSCLKGPYYRRI
ncbi:MAG: FmdE family protein [Nitrososphaerota archaeon]|nr:FmdE family protein [Nitrososphaerota archaeon]